MTTINLGEPLYANGTQIDGRDVSSRWVPQLFDDDLVDTGFALNVNRKFKRYKRVHKGRGCVIELYISETGPIMYKRYTTQGTEIQGLSNGMRNFVRSITSNDITPNLKSSRESTIKTLCNITEMADPIIMDPIVNECVTPGTYPVSKSQLCQDIHNPINESILMGVFTNSLLSVADMGDLLTDAPYSILDSGHIKPYWNVCHKNSVPTTNTEFTKLTRVVDSKFINHIKDTCNFEDTHQSGELNYLLGPVIAWGIYHPTYTDIHIVMSKDNIKLCNTNVLFGTHTTLFDSNDAYELLQVYVKLKADPTFVELIFHKSFHEHGMVEIKYETYSQSLYFDSFCHIVARELNHD